MPAPASTGGIVERDSELAQIDAALAAAGDGSGALLVLEGPAGIGKTSLMLATRSAAEERGMTVLAARGAEIERDFPYGIVRQLFERRLMTAPDDERDRLLDGSAAMAGAALGIEGSGSMRGTSGLGVPHSLYWLTSNLAEQSPLLLIVDDAHWADASSLRFAAYLARRLDGLPVCLAVASRPDEPGADSDTLGALAADPLATLLRLAPLSVVGVAELIAGGLNGAGPADEVAKSGFAAACTRVTAGNPLMVRELIGALAADRVPQTDEGVQRVSQLGPRSVSRSVLLRIGNLDPSVGAVARAAAVLGDGAAMRHAAAVAEVDVDTATAAVDALARVDILERSRPLRFIHPIVREAVYADLAPAERAAAHARAGAALSAEGAAPEAVAAHLMATERTGNPDVVEQLVDAGAVAVDRGAPDAARRYLERALLEPPLPDRRPAVLTALGEADLLSGHAAEAVAHIEEAMALMPAGVEHARAAGELARAVLSSTDIRSTIRAYEAAVAAAAPFDADLAREFESEMASHAWQDPSLVQDMMARAPEWEKLPGTSRAEVSLLACAARLSIRRGVPSSHWAELARRCVARGDVTGGDTSANVALWTGVYALVLSDDLDEVEVFMARAEASGRERGNVIAMLPVTIFRGMVALRRGRPREAEADALDAIATTEATMLHPLAAPMMLALLIEAQVEQGRPADAAKALASGGLPAEMPEVSAFSRLLHARAQLRAAEDRWEESLADALLVGERDEIGGMLNPLVPWRITAATAYARLERHDEAVAIATEWVAIARGLEVPGTTGHALRALAGVTADPHERLAHVEEGVELLRTSPARGEYAHALCDLGAALRATGRRTAALEPLREAHDIALAGGASALHERIVAEMRTAGARPRARMHSGVDALTASERRVAEMAARGDTNKEIAQALFVTAKTVENHLGRVYQKLGVHSRAELAGALEEG